MKRKILKQRSTAGKVKILKIWVDDNKLCREHGYENGAMTYTEKIVSGKNIGKKHETTPQKQAIVEMEALITKKKKKGYQDADSFELDIKEELTASYPLPSSFALSKPYNDPPKDCKVKDLSYCADRKYNGVNILTITDRKKIKHFYTRGMNEITDIVQNITILNYIRNLVMPEDTLISSELIYFNSDGVESPKDLKGIINERTTEAKATARQNRLLENGGHFEIKVFDILMYKANIIANRDYSYRRKILVDMAYNDFSFLEPTHYPVFSYAAHTLRAKKLGWEGLVLRKCTGPESHVKYTFNGKPSRAGAWKLKFNKVDDYFIYETQFGDSGRLKGFLSKFHLGKYDEDHNIVDCGWCGPGRLPTEELPNLQKDLGLTLGTSYPINTPIKTAPITIEVKFASKQLDTNSLEHPVFIRTRPDKPSDECLIEDEPKFYE